MRSSLHVAWSQLSHNKTKLAVAAAGVVVAVMLMLVQLGIRQGALDNSTAIPRRITADLVVVSPRTKTIFQSSQFPRRLLYRLPGHEAVAAVQPLSIGQARFRNPWERQEFPISVYGLDPRDPMVQFPGLAEFSRQLLLPDRIVFDGLSRTTFGPVAAHVAGNGSLQTEVNYRRIHVVGVIRVGISFTTDGNIYTSDANFLRLFPGRDPGAIDVGLVRLRPGVDPQEAIRQLQPMLGSEAVIMTRQQLVEAELLFLRESAPLDFIFGMGAAVGFFIGFVVVYQILYTEITNHLPHYATLKAIGFTDQYLLRVVLIQSLILSLLGYVPGFLLALGVYQIATAAIQMPFAMTLTRAAMVFGLTLSMCGLSAAVAIRKVWTADPADVF